MKNKKRLIVTLFLSLLASLCFVAGCNSCKGKSDDPTGNPDNPAAPPDKIVLADFETWETGLQLIRTGANFGKISWNKDPAYVKDGIGSAKLQPIGGREGGNAQFFYPTESKLFNFDYRDFTDAKSVSFDFYNNEDTDMQVAVGLVPTKGSSGNASNWTTTSYEFQTLPAKQWTTITYNVNISILAMSYDVKEIQGVYAAFPGLWSDYLKDAPELYLDNIVLHKHQEAQKIENLVQLGENEYMDFEHPEWQRYAVKAMNSGDAPEVSFIKSAEEPILKDSDSNKEHLSGDYALKLDIPTGTTSGLWPGVEFAPILLQNSVFNGLDESLYGATTFKFEMFNAGPDTFETAIRLIDTKKRKSIHKSITIPAGSWITFEYNIKELYDDYYAQNNHNFLFTDPGVVNFRWASDKVPEGTVIYIDNMRFEMADIDKEAKPTVETSPFIRQAEVGSLIDFPSLYLSDRYDISLKGNMTAYYKNGENWEELTLEQGKIPVNKVGEYKVVASATNSLKNTTTVERFFEGIAEVPDNLLATYSYADEVNSVWIAEPNRTEESGVTFMEEAEFGGETRKGVLKVVADNKQGVNAWGTGFIGFTFANDYLRTATDGKWKSLTVRMCVTTEVGAPLVYLNNHAMSLTSVPLATNKWVDVTITKNDLNNGVFNTTFNGTGKVLSDSLFYSTANEAFGSGSSAHLFYVAIANTSTDLKKNSKITYYIDEVIWEGNESVFEYEGEVFIDDIYGDEWANPSDIRRKEELE